MGAAPRVRLLRLAIQVFVRVILGRIPPFRSHFQILLVGGASTLPWREIRSFTSRLRAPARRPGKTWTAMIAFGSAESAIGMSTT